MTAPRLKTHRRPTPHAREVGVTYHMSRFYALPSSVEPDIRASVERGLKVELGRAARAAGMRLISEVRIDEDLTDDLETVLYARAIADYDERGNPYSSEPRGRVLNWVRDTAYRLLQAPGFGPVGVLSASGFEMAGRILYAHAETHRALAEDMDLTVYSRQPLNVASLRVAVAPEDLLCEPDELLTTDWTSTASLARGERVRVALLVPQDLTGQEARTYQTLRENGLNVADARAMVAAVLSPAGRV